MMRIQQSPSWLRRSLLAVMLFAVAALVTYIVMQRHAAPPQPNVSQTITAVQSANLPAKIVADKSTEEKQQHTVPASHPRHITIPKLSVSANVISVGLTSDGAMDAPETAWDVGWYDQSALPGMGNDALLLDGHVNNTLGTPGVFYELNTLKAGDRVELERGDGKKFTYRVVTVEQVSTDAVDMARMMRSASPDTQGLNIITCGGVYDYSKRTFSDRILVRAVQL